LLAECRAVKRQQLTSDRNRTYKAACGAQHVQVMWSQRTTLLFPYHGEFHDLVKTFGNYTRC